MIAGYNTNGFAHHRLEDALTILAELGYGSVALTLDVHALDPFGDDLAGEVRRVRQTLQRHELRCVVETGSRFLLDPRRKHRPTLMDPTTEGQACRLDFLRRAIDIATDLGADAVSFWSGANASSPLPLYSGGEGSGVRGESEARTDPLTPNPSPPSTGERGTAEGILFQRLRDGCLRLCDHAAHRQVRLAFEPEPGMFIDTMPRFRALFDAVAHPLFGLTLDIGHLVCMGEVPTASHVLEWRDRLWNVHLEDMRPGIHDHLMFGEGATDFAEVFAGLHGANYAGGLHVELSRHSHDAVRTAERSIDFLRPLIQ
jgi:sugar phosphate isomerase/epimerase